MASTNDGASDSIDLFELLRNVWGRKWLIAGTALLLGGLVAVVVTLVTPRYSATAKVMLNPRDTRVLTTQEVVSDLDLSNPVIETEIALIKSSVLLEAAIREIGLENIPEFDPTQVEDPSAWKLWLAGAIETVTMLLEGQNPAAEDPILEENAEDASLEGDGAEAAPFSNAHRRAANRVRGHLDVFQQGNSYVINISASAENSDVVALIVNTIADRYISGQLEERVEGTRRATAWLETRVDDLREQVAMAEGTLEEHRAEKVAADGGGIETATQQLAAMTAQLALARADHAAARARHDQITALVEAQGFTAAAEVLESPLLTNLRATHAGLMRQSADLATHYGEFHPQRVSLRAEATQAEADLAEEVRKIIEALKKDVEVASIRERSIANDVLALEERVASISKTSTVLRDFEREANALQNVYENMLSRLKETRSHEALAQAEATVIDYALAPPLPSYPKSKLLIVAAIVAGLGIGLAIALVLELSSKTFRSVQQVVKVTRLPVLTALPRFGNRQRLPDMLAELQQGGGQYGERIRQLRTALSFGSAHPPRSIAVTSSVADEGSTKTTLALAHVQALQEKKVIVVDCDFARAALAKDFGWRVSTDFAAVLRGQASLSDAIISEPSVGFDILPVARPVENVSDILTAARVNTLLDELRSRYDVVLLDTPPVLESADARVLATATDGALYMVKWDSTKAETAREGIAALSELGVNLIGIVLSEVKRAQISEVRSGSALMAAGSA